jgi:hypothetical protein
MLDDRVVDVVLCEANEESVFDLAYHNRGTLETTLPFADMPEPPEGDGYDWAKGWRSASVDGQWRAVWRLEGGPVVTFAQAGVEGAAEVLSAVGMGNPTSVKVPFVVARQRGTSATFCTVLEITDDEPVDDLTVRLLTVKEGGDGDERSIAVQVTGRGRRDVVLINPGDGVMRAGPFRLDGQGAALRYRGERIDDMLAIGDSDVQISEG